MTRSHDFDDHGNLRSWQPPAPCTRVTFMALPFGHLFRVPGKASVYRRLDGVAFECVEDKGDRVLQFKAFDPVEAYRG